MKKILFTIIITCCVFPLLAQQEKNITRKQSYETDYMQLSIKQKKTASIMLGGGVVLIVAPALILLNSELGDDNLPGKAVITIGAMAVGCLSVLGSIPLFIAAARNKERALVGSTGFKVEYLPVVSKCNSVNKPFPALVFKLNFR